jgi:hypothetical protein
MGTSNKAHPALGASGDFKTVLVAKKGWPFVFRRAKDGEEILVALNPTAKKCEAALPRNIKASEMQSLAGEATAFRRDAGGWHVALPPASFAVVKMKP